MALNGDESHGIRQLVEKYRQVFRIPENLEHYNIEDYQKAEKQFVKFCLKYGAVMGADGSNDVR